MAVVGQRTLGQLFDMNRSFWAGVSRDSSVPQSVKSMIYQHLQGQWILGNLAVVISPLNAGLEAYLERPVFELNGVSYHYPSVKFWMDHAATAHAPDGRGCDPETHSATLTTTGPNPQLIYAVVLKDGSVKIEDYAGFVEECNFFAAGNGD